MVFRITKALVVENLIIALGVRQLCLYSAEWDLYYNLAYRRVELFSPHVEPLLSGGTR